MYLSDYGESNVLVIQHGVTMSKQPLYAGEVKGTVSFLSPELFFKWDKTLGKDYPVDVFKNDVYGNGILSIEQYKTNSIYSLFIHLHNIISYYYISFLNLSLLLMYVGTLLVLSDST